MPSELEDIWAGDQLRRRDEATMLERFLIDEINALREQERGHSYVLALDAQYGEGKSWFLERLTRQLRLNHPVAFVDAWVDDANEEPFVAIMSAIDEALARYIKKDKKLAEAFKAATRAALPIIGKVAVGAATKAGQRYLGEAIGSEIADEFAKAKEDKSSSRAPFGEAIAEGVGKAGESVAKLVDKQAEAMLKSYRDRKRSRQTFKANMATLTERIEHTDKDIHPPLFVIVDELDRCRPSYAIKLLEEIKHFFDVPNVVFIISLHGSQLTKSIKAVYGAEFDGDSYLQRFFSRRYEMRKLPVRELVAWLMNLWPYDDARLERPDIRGDDGAPLTLSAGDYAGRFLEEFNITPRECSSVVDFLRIFYRQWDRRSPIELSWVLILTIIYIRGSQNREESIPTPKYKLYIKIPIDHRNGHDSQWSDAHSFVKQYWQNHPYPLTDTHNFMSQYGTSGYMRTRLLRELEIEGIDALKIGDKIYSILRTYWNRIGEIGQFSQTSIDHTKTN